MSKLIIKLAVVLTAFSSMLEREVQAQSTNVSTKMLLVTETGMPTTIVKSGANWNFGPGALQSYRGWQYAAFWDANRQVSVARRRLPDGQWECVSLGGYQRTADKNRGKGGIKSRGFGDGHEKVAMGISSDGVIHLSFDHHCSALRYRCSRLGVANDPQQFKWSGKLFGAVQDHLGGPSIDYVTYPNFVRDGDRMSLYLRLNGGSGNADSHFFEYQAGSWSINDPVSSKLIDNDWSGGDGTVNAYPHTVVVHDGRRHLTWCWRDTPDRRTCHDLCYAYSDDHGKTWKNNAGKVVGIRGSKFISADSPGISVVDIPPGSSYVNGGSMVVDSTGNLFVLMKGPSNQPLLVRRNVADGSWEGLKSPATGTLVPLGEDPLKQKVMIVAESGLYEAKAGKELRFNQVGEAIEEQFIDSHFVVDPTRHHHDGIVSVIGQLGKKVQVIDFATMGVVRGKRKGKSKKQPINTVPEPDLKAVGFVSLFDGKTLDGWVSKQGTMKFEVREGAIVGTCSKGPSTFLCTEKDYTDFVFTCEFKWEVDGNSGVQVRSRTRKGKNRETVFGPQVEMEDLAKKGRGWSGGIYGQACGGWLYPLKSAEHRPLKNIIDRSGWNRMTVKIKGNVFKTWINGKPAAHWIDEQNEYPKGFIGLQVHSGRQGTIHWRDLRVKEL